MNPAVKKFSIFLGTLMFSLVGNYCADYALLWYALDFYKSLDSSQATTNPYLLKFLVGQGIGYAFIAPVMSNLADRISKRSACFAIEGSYFISFIAILGLCVSNSLSSNILFVFASINAALGSLYRSNVSFAIMKKFSEDLDVQKISEKYQIIWNLVVIVGVLCSGMFYHRIGIYGCVILGLLSSLPMLALYSSLFSRAETWKIDTGQRTGLLRELAQGGRTLLRTRRVLHLAVSVAVMNMIATLFPALLGTIFQRDLNWGSVQVSITMALGMAISATLVPFVSPVLSRISLHTLHAKVVAPTVLILILYAASRNPYLSILAYIAASCAITFSNVITTRIRLQEVPKEQFGLVNSLYFSVVSLGQIIGSAIIVPFLSSNLVIAVYVAAGAYALAGIYGLYFLRAHSKSQLLSAGASLVLLVGIWLGLKPIPEVHAGENPADSQVVIPIPALPKTLILNELATQYDGHIAALIVQGISKTDGRTEFIPSLAQTLLWSKNRLKLTIRIPEKKFSDGTRVTIGNVRDSLESCIRARANESLGGISSIKGFSSFKQGKVKHLPGLSIENDGMISVSLEHPSPLLLEELSHRICAIVKPAQDGSTDLLRGAVGTGPYRLDKVEPNKIILSQWTEGFPVAPKQVVFVETKEFGNFESLKQWATMIIVPENDSIASGISDTFNSIDILNTDYQQLVLNNSKPPFDRREVRKALAAALDYRLLAQAMGWSERRLQQGMIPYGMRGFRQRPLAPIDKHLVLNQLKSAGYTNESPLVFEILLRDTRAGLAEKEFWQHAFGDFPIRTKITIIPASAIFERTRAGHFEAARLGKDPSSADAYRLYSSYRSTSIWNNAHSKIKKCDLLIDRALQESDTDKRYMLYQHVDECLIEENQILIPLAVTPPQRVLFKKPWNLRDGNRFLSIPYRVTQWFRSE